MDKLPPHLKMNILSILQRSDPMLAKAPAPHEPCEPLPVFVNLQTVDMAKLKLFSKEDLQTLVHDGLLIKDGFLEEFSAKTQTLTSTPSLCSLTLLHVCQDYLQKGKLRMAGMQGSEKWTESSVRGDNLCWLHAGDPELPQALKEFIQCIRAYVSELTDVAKLECKGPFEVQMAHYNENKARYVRHRDAPPSGPPRKLTFIYYPNIAWRCGHGGELRAFLPAGPRDIRPIGDRLVVFWSSWLDHEVLPSLASRFAITVWAR